MKFPPDIWNQLRNKTPKDLISALNKELGKPDQIKGNEYVYRFPDGRRVSIHYHPTKRPYGPKLLKGLLTDIGWTESDMRRLKLIK